MMRPQIPFILFLAACVPVTGAPGEAPPLVVQSYDARLTLESASAQQDQVMRQVMAATANAQSTADTYAFTQRQTADAQAAAEAAATLSMANTQGAISLGLTQVAITSTADEKSTQAAATAIAGTATATAHVPTETHAVMLARIEQTEIQRQAEADNRLAVARDNRAEAAVYLWPVFWVVLILVISGAGIILLWELAEILVSRNRLATVGNIPVWMSPTGPQVIEYRQPLGIAAPAYEPDRWEVEEPEERMVKFSHQGRTWEAPIREKINPEKAQILKLLRQSLAYHKAHPEWDRRRVPGSRELGWDGGDWVKTTNRLNGYVTKQPGEGTFLVGSFTLGGLYEMVGRSDYSPTLHSFRTLEDVE